MGEKSVEKNHVRNLYFRRDVSSEFSCEVIMVNIPLVGALNK